tara:strand:- start:53527 stop:55548 length:2022 start_codon:yes stop_codon:yes gene_type:complete
MNYLKIIFLFFLLVSACQSVQVSDLPLNSTQYGTFDLTKTQVKLVLIPQWHLSPQPNTKENVATSFPQWENQNAIYHQLVEWIDAHQIQNVVVEGCEGEIGPGFKERFNGWSLEDLEKSDTQTQNAALTHVGIKLKARYKSKAKVVCGDSLQLIRQNQLAFSDLRGLLGFKQRIEQFKNSPGQQKSYIETVKKVLLLSPSVSDPAVKAILGDEILRRFEEFTSLIEKRNGKFVEAVHGLPGRTVVVIGALHISDLQKKFENDSQSVAVFRPVGLKNDESQLMEQVRLLLKHSDLSTTELVSVTFERIWNTAKTNIYPKQKGNLFTNEKHDELLSQISTQTTLHDLDKIINPFLDSLGVSHTHLYVEGNPDYYFFRSLFSTHDPLEPKVSHMGAQFKSSDARYTIRTVLQGYPAEKIGLRRGDEMISVDGKPFHPIRSFLNGAKNYEISFLRKGRKIRKTIVPVTESIMSSFLQATENSARIITSGDKKIGYLQLWTGAFNSSQTLSKILQEKMTTVDGLILDLRDGFGAAWWNHLDPFFPDTSSYFVPTVESRDGSLDSFKAETKENTNVFTKPLVVLINEGVRSGKEALAYQFQKTKRAKLIGSRTAGAFVSGRGFFAEENRGYILYLAINGIALDGVKIEGAGISPDHQVEYPFDSLSEDPQFEAALKLLR